ncbi:hypothetical protein KOR34_47580 [Posidoniimonas corsicana]|uniref:NfeD-like C-terminal domain-containing protein n=1 Tax=Posidoniimonas corsicana TaxID=1938618 RepID=A0A5C5UX83_9BACT|nr:NfeD family protein [Posidoniimonas corsicana]TWT30200.1 hypothetical protein KOR34_47580 [Posidoniimonas corsicana]
MFGFLRGPCGDADYRRAYARCCRFQRLFFGARTAPVVSYEGVFAYLLSREALGSALLPESEPTCCRLRGAKKLEGAADAPLGEFAAALGMLLASIKLADDVRDDRSLAARLALSVWRRPVDTAHAYFARLDPAAPARFQSVIDQHVALESAGGPCSLPAFAASTAAGFGDVFSLLADAAPRLVASRETFRRIGKSVGAAIIMADSAADWRLDRRRRLPNPVRDSDAADEAYRAAQRQLVAAANCRPEASGESVSQRVLSAAIQRIESRRCAAGAREPRPRLRPTHLVRAGDCDCPIGACDCGGCDAPACAGDGLDANCCDPSCCMCCDCWPWERQIKKADTKRFASFVGCTGVANGDIGPYGMAVVEGRSRPARTEGPPIPGGAQVLVTGVDELGLIVQRLDSGPAQT